MVEELYPHKKYNIEINAAEIGISKGEIDFVNHNDSKNKALKKMKENRFDVLPIKEPNKNKSVTIFKSYYKTREWGDYSDIEAHFTTYSDLIPVNTSIKDLIKFFVSENRNFFFITKDLNIVGLLTIADLNHPQLRTYLFSLLAELEIILVNLIKDSYSDDELLNIDYGENDEEIKIRYERSKKKGVDLRFAEYLYLPNLLDLIGDNKDLYEKLGYDDKKFTEFKQLSSLRNKIAHAGNPIITSPGSVKTLNKRINLIKESIFRLKN